MLFSKIVDTCCAVTQIFISLFAQLRPEAARFDGKRNFWLIPALLADPAPVAAGLLTRYAALFAEGNTDALLCEIVGRANANDASTDDKHVGFLRLLIMELLRCLF